MIRCESCSTKLGDLSTLFVRGEITRDEWAKRAYQGVQRHHPDWTLSEVGRYVIVRAPFYPFGHPGRHRYPGERVEA